MNRYILIIVFILLTILIVIRQVNTSTTLNQPINKNYDVIKKKDCISKKGQWVNAEQGWWCNNYYEDAGKTCKDGSECLSEKCLVPERSKSLEGACASYFVNPGCFDFLSYGGKHTGFSCANEFLKIETE